MAQIILTHSLSSSIKYFQVSLVMKPVFTGSVFRSPSPPTFLGVQTVSHAIKGNCLSVFKFFEKKSWLTQSGWAVVDVGSLKYYIVCADRASRFDWIRVARPTLNSADAFQAATFFPALSTNSINKPFHDLP